MRAPFVSFAAITAIAAGVVGCAREAPQRVAAAETFARVASGVALVRTVGCEQEVSGSEATGFLVGSQVLVTAYEVVADAFAGGCVLRVRLGSSWYGATSAKGWYDARSKVRDVGLATLTLTRPASGHVFRFAPTLPRSGEPVATFGHPLGLPVSFQQGLFRRAVVSAGVPKLRAWIVADGGSRGGPIITTGGNAIGVVTTTAVPEEDGLSGSNFVGGTNLAEWFGESASSELCRAHPDDGIPDCPDESGQVGVRRWAALRLRPGVAGSSSDPASQAEVSPATVTQVASGVAFLRFSACKGGDAVPGFAASGSTGFLVGSQVMMTARHVVTAAIAHNCRIKAELSGGRFDVTLANTWYDGRSRAEDVDLATLTLERPAPGYIFRFARTLPRRGDTVATLGHPLALPLNFQQGSFQRAVTFRGFRAVAARIPIEVGNSGGPIINNDGDLIGVIALIGLDGEPDPLAVGGPDLTQWFGASANSDLCRAHPSGGIPGCPNDPARPGPRKWLPLKLRSGES